MTQAPEPMIKLQPDGVAPILSYNVPEAISHSGRNFIDLQIPDNYFLKPKPASRLVQEQGASMPVMASLRALAKKEDLSSGLLTPEQVKAALERAIATTKLPPSDALKQLDPQDVIAMAEAGQELKLYRSLYGTLHYTYVEAQPHIEAQPHTDIDEPAPRSAMAAARVSSQLQAEPNENDPDDPGPQSYVTLSITQPTANATITGPDTGATFTISGKASAKRIGQGGFAAIESVEVQVGGGSPFQAANFSANSSTGAWSYSAKATTSGPLVITVRAYAVDGGMDQKKVTANVTLQPPDQTAPTLTILSPANNTEFSGAQQGVTVALKGQASDASGIKSVQFFVDGSAIASGSAQLQAPNAWSGAVLLKTAGIHQIKVRATDNRGNTNERTVNLMVKLETNVVSRLNRIILVESYRLSSFLGNYGAGKTLKTFSLLPGEKTRISIKTYTRKESEAKQASSILDSFNQESADDFEQSMEREQSNHKNYQESMDYRVSATAEARWGWGNATASAEVGGSSQSAREEFSKNVSSATQKHVAKASAKREVEVNTSYEVKEQTGEETSLEREIENINVSRTLNFVFRQMNQEFVTLLHLVDVRIGCFRIVQENGKEKKIYQEVPLPELDSLLTENIVPDKLAAVRSTITQQLAHIFDYQDKHHNFIEEKTPTDDQGKELPEFQYLRIKRDYVSIYEDSATGSQMQVPGIILAANKYVLRTEGIVVEALLGQGEALDKYSNGLQQQAIQKEALHNAQLALEIEKLKLAQKIIETKDLEAAKLYELLFKPAPPVVPVVPNENGNSHLTVS